MSKKIAVDEEDSVSERGNECTLPLVGGLQADQADKRPAAPMWWWCGLGDIQSAASEEREGQTEMTKITNKAKEIVGRPQGDGKMNRICRDTPTFPYPRAMNLTKENVSKGQEVVKGKQVCKDSPRCSNPPEKKNPHGTTPENYFKKLLQEGKAKTRAEMTNSLREVRQNWMAPPRRTTMAMAQQSERTATITKVGKETARIQQKEENAGFSRPSTPPTKTAITDAPRDQTFKLRVAVVVLLVFNMILVQFFGYFWLTADATD